MLFGKREKVIRTILIVEDEPLVAFDTEHFLSEAGYSVIATVDTLALATRVIGTEDVDLVLSDIRLRGDGDGTDVAKAAAERNIPVLFVSGQCPDEAKSLGVGCLAKPYTERMLKSALEALETKLSGGTLKRVPAGLDLYEKS